MERGRITIWLRLPAEPIRTVAGLDKSSPLVESDERVQYTYKSDEDFSRAQRCCNTWEIEMEGDGWTRTTFHRYQETARVA